MKFCFLLLAILVSSVSAADIQAPPWEKPRFDIGQALYRENCSVCHDIDKDRKHSRKIGPSLNHLFQNETLPLSHAKPTRPYVVVKIKFGGGLMPAFRKKLSDSEISTLIDYMTSK